MNKKPYILLAFLFLFSISVSAQVETDIIRPSINAAQFGVAAKAEAALNTGQLSVSIPLMELKGKGYDLPISLTFYNGDVTFSTEASPIGLGWSLMAGGVITFTQRGQDDTHNYYSRDHQNNGNYIHDNWKSNVSFIFDIQNDPMPDEYTYSLPGHSGIMEVTVKNDSLKASLFPDESYRVISIKDGYLITADDGTKFYFNDMETRYGGPDLESTSTTSWFLTRIKTTKGGNFYFYYDDEEYYDLSSFDHFGVNPNKYSTKRLTSIVSDLDSISFVADSRFDRDGVRDWRKNSKRIKKIEWRNRKTKVLVKGFELDNTGLFVTSKDPRETIDTDDKRQMLSSIIQYDSVGNRLPPYKFHYLYMFSHSKRLEIRDYNDEAIKCNSWTSSPGYQAYVDLNQFGNPVCKREEKGTENEHLVGFEERDEAESLSSRDYFVIDSICYPTGAIDFFTYEKHDYSRVNETRSSNYANSVIIQGRRLASKIRSSNSRISSNSGIRQCTKYIYKLHDSAYDSTEISSGVLTNPSIHCATYYTPEWGGDCWIFRASRMSSSLAFNSFMGPPVCYSEVEEVEKGEYDETLSRTIHYFTPQIVHPPVNYIYMGGANSSLTTIENRIYGTLPKYKYKGDVAYLNDYNRTYIAYPVGEFYNISQDVDQPLKEVFIGKDGNVRSIKQYWYDMGSNCTSTKYGYKIVSQVKDVIWGQRQPDYPAYLISQSEYLTRKYRFKGTSTTYYFYNGEKCDSILDEYKVGYDKGRIARTSYTRNKYLEEQNYVTKETNYYFPDNIKNNQGNNTLPAIKAIDTLIAKNMVSNPIKTFVKQNKNIIEGECQDYQIISDSIPLLKTIYKFRNTDNNSIIEPTISDNNINYHADLYKEGEILKYDQDMNPLHVRLKNTQDRIYVWGYDGRYPIAVIDNMSFERFESITNLRNEIMKLESLKKIQTAEEYSELKNQNIAIRNLLPKDAHVTTYTYDPYFGMTSETDDSNLGLIYTYDTFGRLTAKFDTDFNKTEEYNYHYKLQ